MIRSHRLTRLAAGVAATGALMVAGSAVAQDAGVDGGTVPNCSTLTNPIYMSGSSAFEATVQLFALKLSALASPITVVYNLPSGGSCDGVAAISSNTDLTGTAHYYTATGSAGQQSCTLAAGTKADIGVSDVFFESCGNGAKPTTLGDYIGPAQAMLFVVDKTNTGVTSITSLESQVIYSCGAQTANISPFLTNMDAFVRGGASGTQITIAKNIGLAAGAFMGTMTTSSGDMANHVHNAIAGMTFDVQQTIGFIAADAYDSRRTILNALAFRATGQTLAFYADSTSAAPDRRNVRDGHYVLWGYEHMFAPGDATAPTKQLTKDVVGYILGTKTDPSFDNVALEGTAGTIPQCAMAVQRSGDGTSGYLFPSTRGTNTCDCAFEAALSKSTPAGCAACTTDTDCNADGGAANKTCKHLFCE